MRKFPAVCCPQCHNDAFDLHAYESIMVLSGDIALFGLRCPTCGAKIFTLQPIPRDMREELHFAAIEVGAGGLN